MTKKAVVKKKLTTDQELHKALAKEKAPAPIPLVTTPKLFLHIRTMCEFYLLKNDRSAESLATVAQFAFAFREEAFKRFGHDTAETFLLAKMVETRERQTTRVARVDALTRIARYKNKAARLDAEQESAAESIKSVWQAYRKFLDGGGVDYSKPSGRSQVLQPLDVMSDDLWLHYRQVFSPWYEVAKTVQVSRRTANSFVSVAAITYKILVGDMWPEEVDGAFALIKGSAIRALQRGLAAYHEPFKLRIKAPSKDVQPGPGATSGKSSMSDESKTGPGRSASVGGSEV